MPAAKLPIDEEERLAFLAGLEILDTSPESDYDDIVMLAAQLCEVPMASITFIDRERQWFKSRVGLKDTETPRDRSFCAHAILDPQKTLIVEDASLDARFADNPLVTGEPNIRFYAGTPLLTSEDLALGTLCVIDSVPHKMSELQVGCLEALARQVSLRLELRQMSLRLKRANEELINLSLTDDLTGLYNQRGFRLLADQQMRLFRSRRSEREMWLMVADMDGLKNINDNHGHLEGSAAIKAMAGILVSTFRDADILSRFGGDEFAALLLNTQDEVADKIRERLTANIDEYNRTSGKPYSIGASVGFSRIDLSEDTSVDELFKKADAAMYHEKRQRK